MKGKNYYIPLNLDNIPEILNEIEKSLIDDSFFEYISDSKYNFDDLPILDDNDLNKLGSKFKRCNDIILFINYAPHPAVLLTARLKKLQKQLETDSASD